MVQPDKAETSIIVVDPSFILIDLAGSRSDRTAPLLPHDIARIDLRRDRGDLGSWEMNPSRTGIDENADSFSRRSNKELRTRQWTRLEDVLLVPRFEPRRRSEDDVDQLPRLDLHLRRRSPRPIADIALDGLPELPLDQSSLESLPVSVPSHLQNRVKDGRVVGSTLACDSLHVSTTCEPLTSRTPNPSAEAQYSIPSSNTSGAS